ncbi:MAG TPA: DUF72 domain-containing protein, partial [Nitrospiraceae bacterium]
GPFYPPDLPARDMLWWYRKQFDTVEVNNSFYHLPSEKTFTDWNQSTQAEFCFSIKSSRYITHHKKLKEVEPALERFIPVVDSLGSKLGPILFQLPPRWSRNLNRLRGFLDALPDAHRYTFEFRDPSWHDADIYRALSRYNAAFCIYELDGFQSPYEVTADFAYVRLHGPGQKYQGEYSSQVLRKWARRITQWRHSLSAVYVYFDNDQSAYAAKNAAALKNMVDY